MPCSDGLYLDSLDKTTKENQIIDLEAQLCALLTEIHKLPNAEIILEAAEKGSKGVVRFFTRHTKEDEIRLATEISRYSQHELDIIKRLIK